MTTTNTAANDTSTSTTCADCNARKPLDKHGRCRFCAEELSPASYESNEPISPIVASAPPVAVDDALQIDSPVEATASAFSAIASESTSNASVHGIGSQRGPNATMRGVGFASAEGYITALRNGVPAHTHASYLTTLRTRYGMTTADIAALNLPGPMAETTLPVGAGITHTPTGPSIFELPAAQRQFRVGAPTPEQAEKTVKILSSKDLVAGAIAEGYGAIVGWSCFSQAARERPAITRGKLVETLEAIGRSDIAPKAKSARAQAGHVISALNSRGLVARPARKGQTSELASGVSRWTIGDVSHKSDDDSMGPKVLVVTLTDDVLSCDVRHEGYRKLADGIVADYRERVAAEVYQSSDITSWLGRVLRDEHDAIRFGVGWYIPAKHVAAASTLCAAMRDAGFAGDWILPALPVATSDQLRDGILRGLSDEVADLMGRLATERAAAKETRKDGDIGEKRAGSFLRDLREVAKRIVGYGEIMGHDRVAAAKETVRLAIVDLEVLLADDHQGISARFAAVWDEIEFEREREGGSL